MEYEEMIMKRLKPMRKVVLGGSFILLMIFAHTGHAGAQTCVQPPAGLVSWWPWDGDTDDIVGGKNGILQGGVAFTSGQVRQAFSFDGVDGLVATPFILPAIGTIEIWVHPLSLATPSSTQIITGTQGTANGDDRLWIESIGPEGGPGVEPNTFVVNLGSRFINDIAIPNPLSVGVWTHIALTFDYTSDVYRLYINALFVASSEALRNPPTGVLSIGGATSDFGQNFFFHGVIDEVTVYSRVLTDSEIQSIFEAGTAGKCQVQTVGGAVTGASPTKVKCLNLTTRRFVTIRDEARSWNCETAGLTVNPGDSIRMVVEGTAD